MINIRWREVKWIFARLSAMSDLCPIVWRGSLGKWEWRSQPQSSYWIWGGTPGLCPRTKLISTFIDSVIVLCAIYWVICISGCNPTVLLCKQQRTVVRFTTGAVLESSVNETSYNISAAESSRKQIMHHGRVYGLVEFSKDSDDSLLRNCTLQIVYDV